MFARVERGQRDLMMRDYRRDDADEIDVVAFDHTAPIVGHVRNVEFARDFFRVFAMRAGNHDPARTFTVFEAGNLGRARKARADDPDTDRILHGFHRLALEYASNITDESNFVD